MEGEGRIEGESERKGREGGREEKRKGRGQGGGGKNGRREILIQGCRWLKYPITLVQIGDVHRLVHNLL